MKTGYELSFPTAQNAINLVPKWTTRFPATAGVNAGAMDLFNDERIVWALQKFGQAVAGRRVLELGPLEGAHTAVLTGHGAIVDAIEASQVAYIKCLITKEVLQITDARFHLGDCVQWAERPPCRYDLVIACGILYHMHEPLRLLRALAAATDDLYLWTVYVNDPKLKPSRIEELHGLNVRTYEVPYGPKDVGFTGGAPSAAYWMNKTDLVDALYRLGFDDVEVAHDKPRGEGGSPPTFSVYARRMAKQRSSSSDE